MNIFDVKSWGPADVLAMAFIALLPARLIAALLLDTVRIIGNGAGRVVIAIFEMGKK